MSRPRRRKPGTRDALLRELWHAVTAASSLLDSDSADLKLRAVHATAQAGSAYRAALGESELEAVVADLERRAEKANL